MDDMSTTASLPVRTSCPSALRIRRTTLGLRQADLATAAHISRQHLVALELGKSVPSWPVANALAIALDCEPRDIFPQNDRDPGISRAAERDGRVGVQQAG